MLDELPAFAHVSAGSVPEPVDTPPHPATPPPPPHSPCLKRGGRQCFALPGSNRAYFSVLGLGVCVMSHPSDLAPALMALDARVTVAGPAGRRTVPIDRFFRGPRSVTETVLERAEIIASVGVPAPPIATPSRFLQHPA